MAVISRPDFVLNLSSSPSNSCLITYFTFFHFNFPSLSRLRTKKFSFTWHISASPSTTAPYFDIQASTKSPILSDRITPLSTMSIRSSPGSDICVPGSPIDCAATMPTASFGSTFASSYSASARLTILSSASLVSFSLTALSLRFKILLNRSGRLLRSSLSSMSLVFTSPSSWMYRIRIMSSASSSPTNSSRSSTSKSASVTAKSARSFNTSDACESR